MQGPLTAAEASDLVLRLREKREALRAVPVSDVVTALAEAHQRWVEDAGGLRSQAVREIHLATGYAHAAVDEGLRRLFASLDKAELERWLRASGVDAAESRSGGARWVFGPDLGVLVSSGNIPGAAVPTVVQFLLLRSPLLVKTSRGEPALLPHYARSTAAVAPEIAQGLVVTHWAGGDEEVERVVFEAADAVVAYGSDSSIRAIRERLRPDARFIGYGHRISVTLLAREVLTAQGVAELARRVALDFCIYDQQGCLSPQAVYVETGGEVSPEAFAEVLADAFEALARELPRRRITPAESAAIHQYRTEIEMRAFSDSRYGCLASAEGTGWTVVLDPEPAVGMNPLNRTAILKPVPALEAVGEILQPWRGSLISAGLEAPAKRRGPLAERLAALGFTRITRAGRAQDPASALYHDGIEALTTLARFVVVED